MTRDRDVYILQNIKFFRILVVLFLKCKKNNKSSSFMESCLCKLHVESIKLKILYLIQLRMYVCVCVCIYVVHT